MGYGTVSYRNGYMWKRAKRLRFTETLCWMRSIKDVRYFLGETALLLRSLRRTNVAVEPLYKTKYMNEYTNLEFLTMIATRNQYFGE